MRCIVSTCNHDSSSSYSQGITFYMLPTQPILREKWLQALGKEGWKSAEVSVVCSDHFLAKDLYMTKGGQRRLRADAMPVLQNIPKNVNSTTPYEVKVCRICFATDCKLYSMADYKNLNQAYESLAGLMTDDEIELPPYLCVICAHRLLSCARFRNRSLRAHLLLLELVKKHDRITLETIKSMNNNQKSNNFSVTYKTNHYDLDVVHVKKENELTDESNLGTDSTDDIGLRDNNKLIELEINNDHRQYLPHLHEETVLDDVKIEVDTNYGENTGDVNMPDNYSLPVNYDNYSKMEGNYGNVQMASNNPHGSPVAVYIKSEGDMVMCDENSQGDDVSDEEMSLMNLRDSNSSILEIENSAVSHMVPNDVSLNNGRRCRPVGEEVDVEWNTQDFLTEAEVGHGDGLPSHSHYRYITAYENFISWKKEKMISSISEDVLLAYFQELSTKYKPSSLWSTYSMLKSTLKYKDDVDIRGFKELTEFIKRQSDGFTSKKAKILTTDHVDKFLNEAPDEKYLLSKAILIFGITGACRRKELANISINDIENHGELLLVKVPDVRNKVPRTFTIHGHFYKVVKKYQELRVATAKSNRFFQKYHNGKCFNQVVGANRIGSVPKEVATFLKLPDAESYTGHSFRRTSATLLANSGADVATLRRQKHRSAVAKKNVTD